ncbi:unnamed protein product [Larinioides sclopetarius]|uniref:Uncharacterized protein n=1 Tax=Larinioides sclopetarius TaxID=280406 RepID=A0AAV1ZKZ2_9ARAC
MLCNIGFNFTTYTHRINQRQILEHYELSRHQDIV